MQEHKHHTGCCGCHLEPMKRRTFLAALGGTAATAAVVSGCATTETRRGAAAAARERVHPSRPRKALVVQPVLSYQLFQRQNQTSWRSWGGLHTQDDVTQETDRIDGEIKNLKTQAEFPVEFRPLARVTNKDEAAVLRDGDADVMLIYGATGGVEEMETLISPKRYNIVFVRHETGPAYLWYEIAHPRLLRKTVDEYGQPGLEPCDVVVDQTADVLWRLRSFYALKNTVGSRIVCIGGASGWGAGGQDAPKIAKELWKMELLDEPYDDLGKRIVAARQDAARVARAEAMTDEYLGLPGTKLETDRTFMVCAYLLTEIFEDLMAEMNAPAITVNNCMGTIMPLSETTACMPLSFINDDGGMAFCESDFAVIPSGILLHHIAQTPVFLQDPTYPHHGVVTVAHCTAPRKMDGKTLEKTRILTHFESDYGAAPKVDMRIGQIITMIDPDFETKRWIGFRGTIKANPFLDICRSQIDVAIEGDYRRLAEEMRGFHWMLAYGDHLRETGYALRKLGVGWYNLSDDRTMEA